MADDDAAAEAVEWYRPRSRLLIEIAVGALFVAGLGGGVFLLLQHPPPSFIVGLAALLTLAGLACFALLFTLGTLVQIVRRRPILRIDPDGFECAEGRLLWRDLKHVSLVSYRIFIGEPAYETWVRFGLQPGRSAQPPASGYYPNGARPSSEVTVGPTANGIDVPLWVPESDFFPLLRRYYSGDIGRLFVDDGAKPRPRE